jgi:hypothetical protein
MALRRDIIPGTILKAAERAGLHAPDWYVGRTNGHHAHEQYKTLDQIVEDGTSRNADEPEATTKASPSD